MGVYIDSVGVLIKSGVWAMEKCRLKPNFFMKVRREPYSLLSVKDTSIFSYFISDSISDLNWNHHKSWRALDNQCFSKPNMASLDTDVNMVPAGEGSSGAGPSNTNPASSTKKSKRFEIKKWNAVSLWAWGIILLLPLLRSYNYLTICLYEFLFWFSDCLRPKP